MDAHRILFDAGKNGKKRKKTVDAVAASPDPGGLSVVPPDAKLSRRGGGRKRSVKSNDAVSK